MEFAGGTTNGRDGGLLFARNKFDLVLLDLLLPDVDDLSVCKAIRRDSGTPIVMLTAESTAAEIVEGLKSGADDYACKPFGSKELLARIRR
ncbi:MAG TPA: response regulator [Woeseiaceae bacterium]|nr:response regulator [Woeseiaceae bacterium]